MPSPIASFSNRITASKRFDTLLFWAVAALSSMQFALAYVRTTRPGLDLHAFAAGNVGFPYRRRILMQCVYRFGFHFGSRLSFVSPRMVITPEMTIGILSTFCACLLMILSARLFITKLLGRQSPLAWFAFLTIYMANYNHLLVHEIRFFEPYDLPGTALFGLACYAAFVRNRWLYYPVFILATFNRESTLFLPLVFFIFCLREDLSLRDALRRFPFWAYVEIGFQLLAWRLLLSICEQATGGSGPQTPLFAYNLHLLANPAHWPTFASVFGFLWIPYLLFFERIGSIKLQRILWLAPLWAAIMLKYADPLEIRTHTEWTVYLTVCLALIAHSSWTLRHFRCEAKQSSSNL